MMARYDPCRLGFEKQWWSDHVQMYFRNRSSRSSSRGARTLSLREQIHSSRRNAQKPWFSRYLRLAFRMKAVADRYRYCPGRAWAGSMIEREQEEGNEATALLEFHERKGSRSAERKLNRLVDGCKLTVLSSSLEGNSSPHLSHENTRCPPKVSSS